jgi:hypothetical protein
MASKNESDIDSLINAVETISHNQQHLNDRFDDLVDGTGEPNPDSEKADHDDLAERLDAIEAALSGDVIEGADAEADSDSDEGGRSVEERTADLVMDRLENSGLGLSEDADEDAEAEAEDEPTVEDLAADIESIGEQLTETQDALSEASATIERVAKSDGVSQQETNVSDEELLKALAEQAGGPNQDNRSKAQVFGAEKVAEKL